MNINYHYFTIKTLAVHAGFDNKTAQRIAHFSQYIDDFIMSSPFIVDKEPPDFFIKNGLARKLLKNRWVFLPCTTGINMVRTFSSSYKLYTLMPFHFIMTKEHHKTPANVLRSEYRCVSAGQDSQLLINRLMDSTASAFSDEDTNTHMTLGMLFHVFADTYAHSEFSGFQGWENASFVHSMKHNLSSKKGMSKAEIAFYRALPSIGHGNVGSAPDYCDCTISLYGKKTESGPFEPIIERNNGEFFEDCSRRIINILCTANKKPLLSDNQWKALQTKLAEAQNVVKQSSFSTNQKQWMQVFPEIDYTYSKNSYFKIHLDLLHHDSKLLKRLGLKKDDLVDMYSDEGDQARVSSPTLARNVNDSFFAFNETAYRHVFSATGVYASRGNVTQMTELAQMALDSNTL